MKISLITPYFHGERTLDKLLSPLRSLDPDQRSQLEWIIVDDGSYDYSYQELEQKTEPISEVRIIRLDKNHGPSYARNMGIEHARGEYFIFMDSDIHLTPSDFKTLIENKLDVIKNKETSIFTAGLHAQSISREKSIFTRYKTDYMNAIFAPYKGQRLPCSFLYGSLCGWNKALEFRWPDSLRFGEDTYLAQHIISQDYSITFFGDLTLHHAKTYNFTALLLNDFKIPYNFALAYEDFKEARSRNKKFSHVSSWQLAAIALSAPLLFINIWPLSLSLLFIFLWSIANRPLYPYILKDRSVDKKVLNIILTLIDQWVMGMGIFFGLIHARFFDHQSQKRLRSLKH